MRASFSKNSNGLLRNSLTLEPSDFSHGIEFAVAPYYRLWRDRNRVFTMTGRSRARFGDAGFPP
jgi:hypothetical protein